MFSYFTKINNKDIIDYTKNILYFNDDDYNDDEYLFKDEKPEQPKEDTYNIDKIFFWIKFKIFLIFIFKFKADFNSINHQWFFKINLNN